MDKDTIIAALKEDIRKLEKHVQMNNNDFVIQQQRITMLELDARALKKETDDKFNSLRTAFSELLDEYFKLKSHAVGLTAKDIKEETYKWMNKSGLLD